MIFRPTGAVAARSPWFPRSWQIDQGLPNNTIYGLAQTPDGYLWLGTPTGLARFDGARFEGFSSTNFVPRPNRGILNMISLRNGGLALAMDRGALVLLEPDSVHAYLPRRDLPDGVPYALAQDGAGGIWISYREGPVCRVKDATISRFSTRDGLPAQGMCALATGPHGGMWFAKGSSFGVFRDGRFQTLGRLPSEFTRLAAARDGGIWVVSGTHLFKYNEGDGMRPRGEFSSARDVQMPTVVLEDHEGALWIGTAYQGLYHFNGTNFETVPIEHKAVVSLVEDREGSLWVGTIGDGLYQVRPRVVELEGISEGLPFEAVQSLCQDTNGVIWAEAQNGALARRVRGRWQPFKPTVGWNAQATCVAADRSGNVWIGTRLYGLFCWNGERLVSWGNTNDLKGRTIHTLQPTRSGDLWIGEDTPNALQRLHAGKLETLHIPIEELRAKTGSSETPAANPADYLRVIRAMTEGPDGSIWVGTSRGLLFRARGDQVVDETRVTTGEPASIRCLYTSPDGTIWIGYAGWGVGRIAHGRYADIRTEQGLFDDFISYIVADDHGWLWFGGDRGIFKVRQTELEDVADGKAERVHSIHYGSGEGLPSLQANYGSAPGALRSRDGRIWIPMRTALAVINPERLPANSDPPPVRLLRVLVDDRTVALNRGIVPTPESRDSQVLNLQRADGPLRLPPGLRRLQFDFTALSFITPENMRFRYRLDDYDDKWVDGGTERVARYPRLPAGKYTFHVIACNSDETWNYKGATLQLVVTPFIWQRWWFLSAAVTAFTLMVIAIVRYISFRRLRLQLRRFEQQEALHRERARIAKDIHDDVGANLTQIALLSDMVRQDEATTGKFGSRLETVSRTARQAIKSLDEIVWAVNPRNDTLGHLINYTGQFALDYLRVAGIRCRLDLPDQTPEREISTDVRHNLFLLVKEALNNIVKHAHATEVWFRIHVTEQGVRIAVEDNGSGFHRPSQEEGADGLRNMQQRIEDIRGRCRIESEPGKGTRVVVELPWPPMQE